MFGIALDIKALYFCKLLATRKGVATKLLVFFILICFTVTAKAQKVVPWYVFGKYRIDFDSVKKPQINFIKGSQLFSDNDYHKHFASSVVYDYMGRYIISSAGPGLYYTEQMDSVPNCNLYPDSLYTHNTYDPKNRIFPYDFGNPEDLYVPEKDNRYLKFWMTQYLGYGTDSSDSILAEFSKQNGGIYYGRLLNNGKAIAQTTLDSAFGSRHLSNKPISCIAIARKKGGGHWLIAKTWNGTFYSYPMDSGVIGTPVINYIPQKDSMLQYYQPPPNSSFIETMKYSEKRNMIISSRLAHIHPTINSSIYHEEVRQYIFDNENGIISLEQILFDSSSPNLYIISGGCFTKDDSFFMALAAYGNKKSFLVFDLNAQNKSSLKLKICDTNFNKLADIQPNLGVGSDGNIYFFYLTNIEWGMGRINYPFDTCVSEPKYVKYQYINKADSDGVLTIVPPLVFYDPHPIVYDKVLDSCTKPLHGIFVNKSDTIYKQMVIYFGDGDSMLTANKYNDTIVHLYKTAGMLPFAVKGIDALRFSAWLSDTILVSAAPVKADFSINSTISCQYTSLQLNDISKTDTVAESGNIWHWDFGDGNDTILYSIGLPNGKGSIGHIYNQTGSYSVKLIYNNGYCTDTFISPQQIYIAPAPIQGFEINKKISCVPFNLKTSDTSSLAVKRRYIWGDGKDTIITGIYNQSKPAHIYINTGEYTVKQLLSSVNGCTAIDSINISVRAAYKINLGNDTTLCPNNTLILKNIVKDASYLWGNGSTDSMLIVNQQGLYKLTVSLGDCEERDSIQINYYDKDVCDDHINFYPNPFYDKILFSGFLYSACNINVFVYDMTGRLVRSGYAEHIGGFLSFKLDNLDLSASIYLINVVTPTLNMKSKMLGMRNW